MMKQITKSLIALPIALFVFAATFMSCEAQKSATANNPDPAHSAQNSLDYDGIYRGTIPCADCEGIKATVYLMRNNTFKTVYEYLGKVVEPFETTGKFTWNKDGNTVTLTSGNDKTSYFVGENTLTQLDQNGKKMTGALASKYILSKDNYRILHRKWKLIELMGKRVTTSETMNKEAFIQFSDQENRYTAYAGCNSMSGSFSTEAGNKIALGMGISTMMACENMSIERELSKVLSTADYFQVDGNFLILMEGITVLARFVAPVN